MTRALSEIIERVEGASGDGCWIWPRAQDATGRGRLWLNGKIMLAHRAVWTLRVGPIPDGKILCHHCDNPSCVRPSHIYVGTHADNMRDMKDRRRSMAKRNPALASRLGRNAGLMNTWSRGTENPKAKLTVEQVDAIKGDSRPTKAVAAEYGVSRTTIQRVRSGALWRTETALRARLATQEQQG